LNIFEQPLKQWYCDCCSERLETNEGNVEWSRGKKFNEPSHAFKIVHRREECSFKGVTPGDTYEYLSNFVGQEGLFRLIKLLERNTETKSKDNYAGEIAELMRRLHVPYWEEARGKLLQYAAVNQVHPKDLSSAGIDKLREIAEWESK
jgi:hypothetical protein